MHAEPSGRLTLLRRNTAFRILFVATAGSSVGTMLAALALTVDVKQRTDSELWVGALLVADFLPVIVIGFALGPLVDRLSRRGLMIGADLARAVTFVALPFVDHPAGVVVLAAANGVATGFFRPAVWAGLPNLVPDSDREEATSLLSTVENVAWVAGPLASGTILAFWSPSVAYWTNAVTFLVSAALVSRIPARLLQSAESLSRGHWRDVRDGVGLVLHSRALRTVLVTWGTAALATAGINVAEVFLAQDALGSGNVGFGVLVAGTGIGLVVGSFFASTLLGMFGMARVYWGALALMGVGYLLASQAPNLPVAVVFAAIATIGNGVAIVCNQVLVQRGAQDEMRGRALAMLMSLYYALLGLGMAGAAILTRALGPREVWAISGGIYLCAAAIALVMTRRTRVEALARLAEATPADGIARMERLLGEIEGARRAEAERPKPALPYIPRRPPRSG